MKLWALFMAKNSKFSWRFAVQDEVLTFRSSRMDRQGVYCIYGLASMKEFTFWKYMKGIVEPREWVFIGMNYGEWRIGVVLHMILIRCWMSGIV